MIFLNYDQDYSVLTLMIDKGTASGFLQSNSDPKNLEMTIKNVQKEDVRNMIWTLINSLWED